MPASHLNSQGLDVICPVSPAREIRQVELDLVPAIVQPHGHGADEGLHPSSALVVTRPETSAYVLIIQHLGQGRKAADPGVGAPSSPRQQLFSGSTCLREGSPTPTPPFHSRSIFNTANRAIFRNSNDALVS